MRDAGDRAAPTERAMLVAPDAAERASVEPHLTTVESYHVAEHLRHDLFHAAPYPAEKLFEKVFLTQRRRVAEARREKIEESHKRILCVPAPLRQNGWLYKQSLRPLCTWTPGRPSRMATTR